MISIGKIQIICLNKRNCMECAGVVESKNRKHYEGVTVASLWVLRHCLLFVLHERGSSVAGRAFQKFYKILFQRSHLDIASTWPQCSINNKNTSKYMERLTINYKCRSGVLTPNNKCQQTPLQFSQLNTEMFKQTDVNFKSSSAKNDVY